MAEVKAVSRIEAILNGDKVTPVSRVEAILNGDDVKPVSREEYFLKKSASGGVTPTGTKTITENGTYDVTDYASAEVNVPSDVPVSMPLTIKKAAAKGSNINVYHTIVAEDRNGDLRLGEQTDVVTTANGKEISMPSRWSDYDSVFYVYGMLLVEPQTNGKTVTNVSATNITANLLGTVQDGNKNMSVIKLTDGKEGCSLTITTD